ncbi:hypothetical protein [Nitrosomonas sp. Nm34]|uniref:hypothetical protein n=1 Tax=Nitrosomonas sp. Nm34 TaxID=1881055 RepID=UPI0008E2DA69|nr:hypothetical protein [Nitrosomonas sp. Nm34]SFI75053.1 hypothetical protein SAMN05428978_103230 [Nitrosomonas sp. Nm34]
MNLLKKWWGRVRKVEEPIIPQPRMGLHRNDIEELRHLIAYMRHIIVFVKSHKRYQREADGTCKCALKDVEFIYHDNVNKLEKLVSKIEESRYGRRKTKVVI